MEHTIRIHRDGRVVEKQAESGTNLLDFLRSNSIEVSSPCGGKGVCGKCRVKVQGFQQEAEGKEKNMLGSKALSMGYRLACYNQVTSDLDINLEDQESEAEIMTEGRTRSFELQPLITKRSIQLDTPAIHDQTPDADRLDPEGKQQVSLAFLQKLPSVIREKDFAVTGVYMQGKLISVESGDTVSRIFGIAVDIGTTTIAAYLYDLTTGRKLDVYSTLNPQRKFGADVITRIEYTMASSQAMQEMNQTILGCINRIVDEFCLRNGLEQNEIYAVVFAGNTTMMHFLMGLDAKNIAVSPFIPVTTRLHRFTARDMGIGINPNGYAVIMPSVSGYIGADTVAAVLSSGMYEKDEISLMIDIGTNGEIVLGGKQWMVSCSTAAGPAFEGANIRNGVGGIRGAIDRVNLDKGIHYTTIGGAKPVGICGSGIIDAVAAMLSTDVIDETGRIAMDEEVDALPPDLGQRVMEIDGKNAFLLVPGDETETGTEIAVTQRDIRELQNAKAAIAAGIKTLAKTAGIGLEDIHRVYLAGGFGNYINIDSALMTGLIPRELEGRVDSIGNAAGAGAAEALLSSTLLEEADKIRGRIRYVELSASPAFVEEYVECMMFEK